MSAVAELDASLQALLPLKAPGVTKSRIASITALCVEHVKSESVLVQKIYTHFKRTPGSHKLGVLYVVDSVTRQWIDKAGAVGQELSGKAATDGTYAAGVYRVTELLPLLMNDLIGSAPDDQKDKILKLVDIWDRGSIFPKQLLDGFKKKIESRPPKINQQPTQPAVSAASLPQPVPTSQQPTFPAYQANSSQPLPGFPTPQTNGSSQAPPPNMSQAIPQPAVQPPPQAALPAGATPESLNALAAMLPPGVMSDPQALTQYLQLMQQLVQLGVPSEQWPDILAALGNQKNGAASAPSAPTLTPAYQQPYAVVPNTASQPLTQTLGLPRGPEPLRNTSTPRDRSRSPQRVQKRGSPVYNSYGQSSYRQRSPTRSGSPAQQADKIMLNSSIKRTEVDPTLPNGHIKVLSRTLFVGGTQAAESELKQIFSRFGEVQSVIANASKRHAFVKMCTRPAAVAAKDGMDQEQDTAILGKARSTKWGVGFGPRECCDYAQGVSVIPIDRLTDADRRWILNAEYGGTGGKEPFTGLVMEEPDIEIGAGVSSKAISLRVGGGAENNNAKRSGSRRRDRQQDHQQRFPPAQQQQQQQAPQQQQQQQSRRAQHKPTHSTESAIGVPPSVPGFGFQFPGMPGFAPGMPPFGHQ